MSYDHNSFHENLWRYRQPVEMPGGWMFDTVKTLKKVDLYLNSQFESGARDSSGRKKRFYNIVNAPCEIAAKFIDLDTKNMVLFSEGFGDEGRMWLLERDLKDWMKRNEFSIELNRFSDAFPRYGHLLSKHAIGNKVNNIKIENMRTDPTTDFMVNSDFNYEAIPMTRTAIEGMRGVWDGDEIDELFALFPNENQFVAYECYDMNPDGTWYETIRIDCFSKSKSRSRQMGTEALINQSDELMPSFVMFEDSSVDELPFDEVKWCEVPGRWFGQGFTEVLFDAQGSTNETKHMKRKGLELSSRQIFSTADENLPRNIMTDLDNGDILKSRTGITQINTQTPGLAEFASEENSWSLLVRALTFSYDIASGDELPSGTPLGVARISAAMVESYFSKKREKLGIFLKRIIMKQVVPAFEKDRSKEHVLRLMTSDAEVEKLRRSIIDYRMNQAVKDYASRTGTVPSPMAIALERMRLEAKDKKKKDISALIPSGFYKGMEYGIDMTVTGEEIDIGARQQTLTTAMTTLATNPGLLANPATRSIFLKLLQLAGVNPMDLDMINTQAEAAPPMGAPVQQAAQPQPQAQPA